MRGPECLLPDGQRPLVERLGLLVESLLPVNLGEVVEALADIGMVWAEGLLPDRQRPPVKRLGLRVTALDTV